jgi:hypothetical protein
MNVKPSFSRAQVSSLIASGVDLGFYTLWYELWSRSSFNVSFLITHAATTGTAFGALLGAVVNFLLNRHWSFRVAHMRFSHQALKYFIVSAISLFLNVAIVYLLHERIQLFFLWARIVSGVSIGVLFNYPLHKYFVFTGQFKETSA